MSVGSALPLIATVSIALWILGVAAMTYRTWRGRERSDWITSRDAEDDA